MSKPESKPRLDLEDAEHPYWSVVTSDIARCGEHAVEGGHLAKVLGHEAGSDPFAAALEAAGKRHGFAAVPSSDSGYTLKKSKKA